MKPKISKSQKKGRGKENNDWRQIGSIDLKERKKTSLSLTAPSQVSTFYCNKPDVPTL